MTDKGSRDSLEPQRRGGGAGRLGVGLGRGHAFGIADEVFASRSNTPGMEAWARDAGWSSVNAPTTEFQEVVSTAPLRLNDEYEVTDQFADNSNEPSRAIFNISLVDKRNYTPEYAVSCIRASMPLAPLRLSPSRLWRARTKGWVPVTLEDATFAARWKVLRREDVLSQDSSFAEAELAAALMATDDGDELWSTGSWLAAVRPDGHRPDLATHHMILLEAVARALS